MVPTYVLENSNINSELIGNNQHFIYSSPVRVLDNKGISQQEFYLKSKNVETVILDHDKKVSVEDKDIDNRIEDAINHSKFLVDNFGKEKHLN